MRGYYRKEPVAEGVPEGSLSAQAAQHVADALMADGLGRVEVVSLAGGGYAIDLFRQAWPEEGGPGLRYLGRITRFTMP